MIITIDEVWDFLETTYVTKDLLHILDKDGCRISDDIYLLENKWEFRFDILKLKNLWEDKHTFIVHSSNASKKLRSHVEKIEQLGSAEGQSHIYMGKEGSVSFGIHSDKPDNLIFQCEGKSKVTIFEDRSEVEGSYCGDEQLTVDEEFILTPGKYCAIPSLRYHKFEPLTDRLSVSLPLYKKYNNTTISLNELLGF